MKTRDGDHDDELHINPPTPCLWQAPASTQKTKRKTRPAIRRSARWRVSENKGNLAMLDNAHQLHYPLFLFLCPGLLQHTTSEVAQKAAFEESAPGSTRSCDPESTSICGDVGEVDPQSRSVAAIRGWPAAAGQGARFIGVDLRSTQRGRPKVKFDRSRPAVDSARSPQGRL